MAAETQNEERSRPWGFATNNAGIGAIGVGSWKVSTIPKREAIIRGEFSPANASLCG